jgi:hypothetical protein
VEIKDMSSGKGEKFNQLFAEPAFGWNKVLISAGTGWYQEWGKSR